MFPKNLIQYLDGWIGSETLGCFQFLHRAVDLFWVEAHLKCVEIGGYLAEPRTARYTANTTGYSLGHCKIYYLCLE